MHSKCFMIIEEKPNMHQITPKEFKGPLYELCILTATYIKLEKYRIDFGDI